MLRTSPNATVFILGALLTASCGEKAVPGAFAWNVERLQIGDTTVVRNSGANSPLAELTLVPELVIGKVVGGDQEMFGNIMYGRATADGGVVITEERPYRIQRLNSSGRMTFAYGARGDGPGEFRQPGRVVLGADGRLLHWDTRHKQFAVYDGGGKYLHSWRLQIAPGIRINMREAAFDSTGVLSVHTDLSQPRDSGAPDEKTVILRTAADGTTLATLPEPAAFGPPNITLRFMSEGYPMEFPIPYSPLSMNLFVTPGLWASMHSGSYSILLHQQPTGLLRMESDLAATPMDLAEREDAASVTTRELRPDDKTVNISASHIPDKKPYFKKVFGDESQRIWVDIYRPSTRVVEMKCRASRAAPVATECANGTKPQPVEHWAETVAFDIFLPTGEFAGRVTLADSTRFMSAMSNKVWLAVANSLGVQTMVRYRVVADPGSPYAQYWQ